MKNPRLKVELSTFDYCIEAVSILFIVFSIILPLIYSDRIFDKVPTHFNLSAQPDTWSEHGTVWLLPIIGLIIYIVFTVLNRYPFIYRYPVKVTKINAFRLYKLGTRTIRITKLLMAWLLAGLTYDTIQIGLNQSTGSAYIYLLTFLITCISLMVIMLYKMKKN
jgi:uncharacterized membrane protein